MRAYNTAFVRKLLLILLLTVFNGAFADTGKNEIPPACRSDCKTPYGKELGHSPGGIEAYSNCQSNCVIFEPNKLSGTYTGIKWQCVEYARRWLLVKTGAVYGDVDTAADIWNKIDHLTEVKTKKQIPLDALLNGSTQAPVVGDLLIYAKEFYNTGHVAVVTGVDLEKGEVKVAEQNYNNTPWPGDYARNIVLYNNNGHYWLLDGYLLGWKHIAGEVK